MNELIGTMADNLSHLEARVEGLIQHLERALRRNEELRARIAELEGEAGRLRERNSQLEGDANSSADREDQIRDRLRSILGKIDVIEQEIGASGAHGG